MRGRPRIIIFECCANLKNIYKLLRLDLYKQDGDKSTHPTSGSWWTQSFVT